MNKLIIAILGLSIFIFSCQENKPKNETQFQSNWSNEKDIVRPWAGNDFWLNPLQAWEQRDGELNVVASGGDRNCVILTRELNEEGNHFEMEVDIEKSSTNDTSGWAGFKIGLKGQFNDYRDDAVYGRGICLGVTNDRFLFIGNNKEKIQSRIRFQKYHLKLVAKKINKNDFSVELIYSDPEYQQSIISKIQKSWLKGLVALSSSESIPDGVDLEQEKPRFEKLPALNKKVGGNTFHSFSNLQISGNKLSEFNERIEFILKLMLRPFMG